MHDLDKNIHLNIDLQPLVDAIRTQKAVVYVGAGASISAGLPDWERFLKKCLERSKESFDKNSQDSKSEINFELAEKLLENGDYLMSAELLQQEIGSTLSTYIWDIFGTKRTPSSIHKAIARIPFSLAITTNYDKLLEGAYNKIPNVFTWLDPQAIFSSMKHNRFAVIKTHGDVGNEISLVLTKTNYRNLMHLNKAFNEEMITLLSQKTFLFIGSSLRDHDLLKLMDEARLTYGNNFGPHYAFLFKEEVDESFIRYLRDSYNIHVIVSVAENKLKTDSVCSFLKILSGRVSELSIKNNETIAINSDLFCFNKMVHDRLRDILKQTGAEKGMVAFIDKRDLPGLKHIIKENIFEDKFEHLDFESTSFVDEFGLSGSFENKVEKKKVLNHKNILEEFYNRGYKEQSHIYYRDVTTGICEPQIEDWNFKVKKETSFRESKSVLLTQVFSDGQTVGVILIESSIIDAFTIEHLKTLKKSTVLLSAIFKELELRKLPLDEIDLETNSAQIQKLMDCSFLLNGYEVSYLFYEIDHRNGKLVAHYDKNTVKRVKTNGQKFSYDFGKLSLATHALESQQEIYFEDVQIGVKRGTISEIGVAEFGITGAIYATPIRVCQYNSFIIVAWSRANKSLRNYDRISRLAHLIANSTDRTSNNNLNEDNNKAITFINTVNEELRKIDNNLPWQLEFLENESIRTQLYSALLRILTYNSCNIGRVRLWFFDKLKEKFICIYSYSQTGAIKEGQSIENQYINVKPTKASNVYCQFTIKRFKENPYAMHQHRSMFSESDDNNNELDKDPDGKWIVGPIVYKKSKTLLGFISADNHFIVNGKPKDILLGEKQDAFQKYAIDLISDLLVPVLRLHKHDLEYNDLP